MPHYVLGLTHLEALSELKAYRRGALAFSKMTLSTRRALGHAETTDDPEAVLLQREAHVHAVRQLDAYHRHIQALEARVRGELFY